jgi:hypothetical protein
MAMAIGSGNERKVGRLQEAVGGPPPTTENMLFLSF